MKTPLTTAALAALVLSATTAPEAVAQLKPSELAGRWMMVASTPSLEELVVEYSKAVGYAPSREKEAVDEIREMKKERTPQLVRITETDLSFEGVEVFGSNAAFSYSIDGNQLKVTFTGVAGATGGAGSKVEELVPEFFVASLSGNTLNLKSGPIPGYKGKSVSYKLQRYTKVEGEMREWQGTGGKTFEARVVDYKDGVAVLENSDGKTIKVTASKLPQADKDYLLQLIKDSK
jgi:hypothetical protein